jgi:hypothetical protein
MKPRCRSVVAGVILLLRAGWLYASVCPALPEGLQYERLSAPAVELAYRFEPAILKVGTFFLVDVTACVPSGAAPIEDIRVEARMPAHGHGMNYRPTGTRIGPQRFRFAGLMLHMPGHWEFTFDVFQAGKQTRLTRHVEITQ